MFQVCSTGAIDRRRWRTVSCQVYSWNEGEEEEAYFFLLVCAPQIKWGESEVEVYFVVGCLVDHLVDESAEQRNNEKPVFPRLFFCMKRSHI